MHKNNDDFLCNFSVKVTFYFLNHNMLWFFGKNRPKNDKKPQYVVFDV